MTTILSFIFVLGVLIFVHELGHFVMARRIGVRVLTFSLGFGPKLLRIKRGDTEFCVCAIPLGGYVKMAGENPDDPRSGAGDEFLSKTKWQRFQVLVAGPVMNIVLAWIVMALVLYQGAPQALYWTEPAVIGAFTEGSVAQAQGLQAGDRIAAVDDTQIDDWNDLMLAISTKANRQVTVKVDRGGQIVERQLTPSAVSKYEIGDIGIEPVWHPQITAMRQGEPAEQGGLQAGDVILAAGGERNVRYARLIELIKAHDQRPLALDVRRGDEVVQITVTPREIDGTVRIGANMNEGEVRTVNPGPIEAMKLSAEQNWEWAQLILTTLKGLFTRDTPMKQLMGPVGIAEMSGSAASAGWLPLFTLLAMISLNLGLLNLMPVPVLDGGHITILALEGISRRDFSMKVKEKMLMVGFVLLVTLMVTVIYNDLTRVEWINRLMPWRG